MCDSPYNEYIILFQLIENGSKKESWYWKLSVNQKKKEKKSWVYKKPSARKKRINNRNRGRMHKYISLKLIFFLKKSSYFEKGFVWGVSFKTLNMTIYVSKL